VSVGGPGAGVAVEMRAVDGRSAATDAGTAAPAAAAVPAAEAARRPEPCLVAVSGSLARHDARVLKSAATAAAAGYRVVVVAPSASGQPEQQDLGGWTLLEVPVGDRARQAATRPRTLGRLGYRDTRQAAAARAALDAARAEPSAGALRARLLQARTWVVTERTVVMRYRQTRRLWAEPWAQPVVRRALRLPSVRDWRRLVPESLDLDEAFAPVIESLRPDVLHSHDVQTVNVVAGVAERAAGQGRVVRWIYDAHEHVPGLTTYPPDRLAGLVELEAAFARRADGVLTVCDPIADDLWRRFGLARRPTVVVNAPRLPAPGAPAAGGRSLHADAGLAPDVPIVVYSGKLDRDRGIDDLVGALELLPPAVHVVLITDRAGSYLDGVRARARAAGCGDRLRTVAYVPPAELVGYLSEAAVGFAGFSHIGNHEVALPNKFFDYLHAGVPMVVSDLRLLGPLVRRLNVGRVYPFGDARALASVITLVLRERAELLPALQDPQLQQAYSWQAQEPALLDLYQQVLAAPAAAAAGSTR
jgi:glycosyltransferase involved in cell wall biosynthesis